MSAFVQSKPLAYLRTYGKQKRKVEQWFSPDLRKKAFSFSSTSSSDQSIPELTSKRRKTSNKKSTASSSSRSSRTAKRKAMEALKELESDEDSVSVPGTAYRRNPSTKLTKKTAVPSRSPIIPGPASSEEKRAGPSTARTRKQLRLRNSENSGDSFVTDRTSSNAFHQRTSNINPLRQRKSVDPLHVGRFVTQRRRAQHTQPKQRPKQSLGISISTLNMSKGLRSVPPDCQRPPAGRESEARAGDWSAALREISLNEGEERVRSSKRPLLCSTPSLGYKRCLHHLEPSLSEISSFSCDESDMPPPLKGSTGNHRTSQPPGRGVTLAKPAPKTETAEPMEERSKPTPEERADSNTQSATPYRKHFKKRAVIVLKELAESHIQHTGEDGKQAEENTWKTRRRFSPRLEAGSASSAAALPSCRANQTPNTSSDYAKSNASGRTLHSSSSSFSSVSACSAPPTSEVSTSLPTRIDRLKVECLSSRATVCLQRLDPGAVPRAPQEASVETPVDAPLSLKSKRAQNAGHLNLSLLNDVKCGPRPGNPVRQTSASSTSSAVSSTPSKGPGKMAAAKDHGLFTSRKVCVSGLNSSRWSKKGVGEHSRTQRQNEPRTKPGDFSSSALLLVGADSYMGESAWLQHSRLNEFPKTPLRTELLNLSTFFNNFTPDSLTTHTWGRLKAALSIHKKKTACPTPRRLALKHGLVDTSLDLFGTPLSNRVTSPLYISSINTSTNSVNDDISDAEKVYQECHQEGPLSFHDCIPPDRMKHCVKVGEGTFGEVFSVINKDHQTVALKIIPVEGLEKVNGEPQKTFGEVLHEIIISKELSALNSTEHNKTNGFIGLINLHCVCGSYPDALLNAWDKFDQEKESENDRPDFFGGDQLFLILEFEFGGSDLENMNGKITSMAQAKSVLHQVTAALAVAEEALCFEHRDLHWGNILVKPTKQKHNQFTLNDSVLSIQTRGVHVNIIDYSLSRLEIDGLTVSCDIANEEELFMGQGDYQFEIYRLMKKENNNCWLGFHPHSNVLWLHYLAQKLLTMKYKMKPQSSQQKASRSSLKSFHSEVLNYRSAKDVLLHSALFH